MNQYDNVVKSIIASENELEIMTQMKEDHARYSKKSPWRQDSWFSDFIKANYDNMPIMDAPINKLLMVVSDSLGTFYSRDRGHSIIIGSILIKLSENTICCVDSQSWYGIPDVGAHVFSNNGYFEFGKSMGMVYGKVKEILKVNLVSNN